MGFLQMPTARWGWVVAKQGRLQNFHPAITKVHHMLNNENLYAKKKKKNMAKYFISKRKMLTEIPLFPFYLFTNLFFSFQNLLRSLFWLICWVILFGCFCCTALYGIRFDHINVDVNFDWKCQMELGVLFWFNNLLNYNEKNILI